MMRDAVQLIQSARRVFAASHVDHDGDAVGSLLGFAYTLRRLGKTVTVALADPVSWRFEHLPGAEEIRPVKPSPDDDLLVSLDASEFNRLGAVLTPDDLAGRPLLMIDHHITNSRFGTVNVLDPTAASTCEILYALALALGVTPDPTIATCLLTGVVTDTLGFRTTSTTPRSLEVAQALMQAGADLSDICQRAFNSDTYARLCLTADVLHRMTMDNGVLWSQVTLDDLRRLGVPYSESAGLVGYLNSVREARVAVIFRENEDGRIDVSMRSKPGISLAPVALALGGGGHPQAAGATLPPPIQVARERALAEIRKLLDGTPPPA